VVGYAALDGVDHEKLAWPLGFAGGALLASLADTLMPEAYSEGRAGRRGRHSARVPPLLPGFLGLGPGRPEQVAYPRVCGGFDQ
jgi:hypothetical protein